MEVSEWKTTGGIHRRTVARHGGHSREDKHAALCPCHLGSLPLALTLAVAIATAIVVVIAGVEGHALHELPAHERLW